MKRSTAKVLSIICAIAAIVIACLFIPSDNQVGMAIVFIIYIPIAIWLNSCQRCKHCGRWPRRGDFFAEFCAGCGEPLDD